VGLTTPELVAGPQDSTGAWIGGYPEGSQAGPVPVSTSGLGSGPTLANVAFPDSILSREFAPDLRAEDERDRDMEIREEGLSYKQAHLSKCLPLVSLHQECLQYLSLTFLWAAVPWTPVLLDPNKTPHNKRKPGNLHLHSETDWNITILISAG